MAKGNPCYTTSKNSVSSQRGNYQLEGGARKEERIIGGSVTVCK
jgi:hypothetical protein